MTLSQHLTFSILVDGLWSGEISENEAIEVVFSAGIPAEHLNAVLNDIREEDGTWS